LTAPSKSLIFDADDTLWENNVYFEEAFDQFCAHLAHSSLSSTEIRAFLDEIEIANAKTHGYGSKNFGRNLASCYRHLSERNIAEHDLETVIGLAHAILDRPIELIEGVKDTLEELAERHTLTLFTKGDREEQQFKIERSGLGQYFTHAAIVKEKNEPAYRELTQEKGFAPETTWMIGNSPKSDILPALTAGLNAVFVPHARTWSLEQMELPSSHPRLQRISSIRELTQLF
jgi:putative hydrolase of the HAD superfamily